ncbi:MAG: NAD(+) synthase, partial [Deltaproteobacteria bacterium]|nr:NAD(+) synthase [Deltaproteobacteria bacterium]
MESSEERQYFNLYNHGFIRVAVCIPELKVADAPFNVASTIKLVKQASANNAILALFPELGISAYSNEDLFHQDALLQSVV